MLLVSAAFALVLLFLRWLTVTGGHLDVADRDEARTRWLRLGWPPPDGRSAVAPACHPRPAPGGARHRPRHWPRGPGLGLTLPDHWRLGRRAAPPGGRRAEPLPRPPRRRCLRPCRPARRHSRPAVSRPPCAARGARPPRGPAAPDAAPDAIVTRRGMGPHSRALSALQRVAPRSSSARAGAAAAPAQPSTPRPSSPWSSSSPPSCSPPTTRRPSSSAPASPSRATSTPWPAWCALCVLPTTPARSASACRASSSLPSLASPPPSAGLTAPAPRSSTPSPLWWSTIFDRLDAARAGALRHGLTELRRRRPGLTTSSSWPPRRAAATEQSPGSRRSWASPGSISSKPARAATPPDDSPCEGRRGPPPRGTGVGRGAHPLLRRRRRPRGSARALLGAVAAAPAVVTLPTTTSCWSVRALATRPLWLIDLRLAVRPKLSASACPIRRGPISH